MTVRKERKSRKLRGYRSHGYGRVGQHRKSGSKGGVGNAGRKSGKHKYSWVLRYAPDYFGKHGFKNPNPRLPVTIDLLEISHLAEKLISEDKLPKKGDYYEFDITKYGYDKVLSGGMLNRKLVIIAREFSKKAEEKIKEAGSIPLVKNASS